MLSSTKHWFQIRLSSSPQFLMNIGRCSNLLASRTFSSSFNCKKKFQASNTCNSCSSTYRRYGWSRVEVVWTGCDAWWNFQIFWNVSNSFNHFKSLNLVFFHLLLKFIKHWFCELNGSFWECDLVQVFTYDFSLECCVWFNFEPWI